MASTLPNLPIFQAIAGHDPKSPAVIHSASQRTFTYGNLLADVIGAKERLSQITRGKDLQGERAAFLADNSYDYVVTFLSILAHSAIAVPLAPSFPNTELRYILDNSSATLLLSTTKFGNKAQDVLAGDLVHMPQLGILEEIEIGHEAFANTTIEVETSNDGGLMLYTSGTTNRPKGVVLPSSVLTAQARSLIKAWDYSPSDLLLHVLPLHHIHGTVNAVFTPLMAGSAIEFAFPFNSDIVWKRLATPFLPDSSTTQMRPITFLTVVPTIYSRLLSTHQLLNEDVQQASRTAISPSHMRLNISGSAALPTPTKAAWTEMSKGNVLLERYGMTEVGMALSCGLEFADRVDGSVGWPLPSVEVRLVDIESGEVIAPGQEYGPDGTPREGEIQLRGPTVFREYWKNPKATAEEFVETDDGRGKWFKTGDVAARQIVEGAGLSTQDWAKGPMYFIKGRSSVDIIKSGGEKISALEIERELLSLPVIAEAAVVGIESEQWGQKVAAVIVLNPDSVHTGKAGKPWGIMDMRRALKDRLVNYKIPQELKIVEQIPRNAMGKVNKKTLITQMFGSGAK